MPLGVVVERRKTQSPWADYVWRPVSVFAGAAQIEDWHEMRSGEGWTQFHAATVPLELHRSEAEDYKRNLSSPKPAIYVVLAPAAGAFPWRVKLATASPYEGEGYMVGDENVVEAVTMPEAVAAWIAEFAEANFKPAEFKKRRRDTPPAIVEERFGKEPIFTRTGRVSPKGNGHG